MELRTDESFDLRSRPVARACVPSALSFTRQKPSPETSMSFLKYVGLVTGPLLDCGREADFSFHLSPVAAVCELLAAQQPPPTSSKLLLLPHPTRPTTPTSNSSSSSNTLLSSKRSTPSSSSSSFTPRH